MLSLVVLCVGVAVANVPIFSSVEFSRKASVTLSCYLSGQSPNMNKSQHLLMTTQSSKRFFSQSVWPINALDFDGNYDVWCNITGYLETLDAGAVGAVFPFAQHIRDSPHKIVSHVMKGTRNGTVQVQGVQDFQPLDNATYHFDEEYGKFALKVDGVNPNFNSSQQWKWSIKVNQTMTNFPAVCPLCFIGCAKMPAKVTVLAQKTDNSPNFKFKTPAGLFVPEFTSWSWANFSSPLKTTVVSVITKQTWPCPVLTVFRSKTVYRVECDSDGQKTDLFNVSFGNAAIDLQPEMMTLRIVAKTGCQAAIEFLVKTNEGHVLNSYCFETYRSMKWGTTANELSMSFPDAHQAVVDWNSARRTNNTFQSVPLDQKFFLGFGPQPPGFEFQVSQPSPAFVGRRLLCDQDDGCPPPSQSPTTSAPSTPTVAPSPAPSMFGVTKTPTVSPTVAPTTPQPTRNPTQNAGRGSECDHCAASCQFGCEQECSCDADDQCVPRCELSCNEAKCTNCSSTMPESVSGKGYESFRMVTRNIPPGFVNATFSPNLIFLPSASFNLDISGGGPAAAHDYIFSLWQLKQNQTPSFESRTRPKTMEKLCSTRLQNSAGLCSNVTIAAVQVQTVVPRFFSPSLGILFCSPVFRVKLEIQLVAIEFCPKGGECFSKQTGFTIPSSKIDDDSHVHLYLRNIMGASINDLQNLKFSLTAFQDECGQKNDQGTVKEIVQSVTHNYTSSISTVKLRLGGFAEKLANTCSISSGLQVQSNSFIWGLDGKVLDLFSVICDPVIETFTSNTCLIENQNLLCQQTNNSRLLISGRNFFAVDVLIGGQTQECSGNATHLNCSIPNGRSGSKVSVVLTNRNYVSDSVFISYQLCPSGTHWFNEANTNQVGCFGCLPGKFSEQNGTAYCFDCPQGSYSNTTASTACKLCEPGRFQNETGRSTCNNCTFPWHTNRVGQSNCEQCNTDFYAVLDKSKSGGVDCRACPPDVVCKEGIAEAAEGYWLYTDPQLMLKSAVPCLTTNCPQKSCGLHRKDISVNPLCASCEEGFFQWGEDCLECKDSERPLRSLAFFGLVVVATVWTAVVHKIAEKGGSGATAIFIFFVQSTYLLVSVDHKVLSDFLGFFNMNLVKSSSFSFCVAELSDIKKMWLGLAQPVMCLSFLWIFALLKFVTVSFLEAKRSQRSVCEVLKSGQNGRQLGESGTSTFSFSHYLRTTFSLLIISFNAVAEVTLSFFHCLKLSNEAENSMSVLSSVPSIVCFDPEGVKDKEYIANRPIALALLFVVVIGFPVATVCLLYKIRVSMISGDRLYRMRYGPLYEIYKKGKYLVFAFPFFSLLRRILLIVIVTQISAVERALRFSWISVTCIFFLCLHGAVQPFRSRVDNQLENLSLATLALISTALSGIDDRTSAGNKEILLICTFILFLFTFCVTLSWLLFSKLARTRRMGDWISKKFPSLSERARFNYLDFEGDQSSGVPHEVEMGKHSAI